MSLPLIPSYLTYITGISFDELVESQSRSVRRRTLFHSLFFILGFTLVFVALGASATYVGNFFQENQALIRRVGGVIVILLGIHITGLVKLNILEREKRFEFNDKPLGYLGFNSCRYRLCCWLDPLYRTNPGKYSALCQHF